jgi:DNA-binding CsgD family transcriptional regulator
MRLSHHDYRRVNDAVVLLYRLAFTEGPLKAIVEVLPRTIGGTISCASICRPGIVDFAVSHPIQLPDPVENEPVMLQHPRVNQPQGGVFKISDVVSRVSWHRQDFYHFMLPYLILEDDLGIDLALPDGSVLRACMMRDVRTFREEDREIFSLLLPHFISLLSPPTSRTGSLAGLGLTRREQDVLHWVAEGKTNAETAAILHIAPGTVKVHLERIYEKLGVENRHNAARKALEAMNPRAIF